MGLLLEAIQETADDVGERLRGPEKPGPAQYQEAFQLIAYKLERLRSHVMTSRRLLSDLRALRRMLRGENGATLAVP